jgi:CBS domain-containing protein
MEGITLFIFGGVAEMSNEPPSAKAEFMMAIAGPLSSIGIGLVFYVMYRGGMVLGWPGPMNGVMAYLAIINLILAGFNLIPAFPLDGGRVLRSILWGIKKNIRWATRISSRIGFGFGIFLVILGFFNVLNGNFIGGMWWFLIGMFLQSAAKMSYQQLLLRRALEGESVRRFMKKNPITVPPSTLVDRFVEDYIYRYHFKMFPVVDSDKLLGCVTTKQVKEIPRDAWHMRTVADITTPCSEGNTIGADQDAIKALSVMKRAGAGRLMVIEEGHLAGVIALKDMLDFLSLKVELDTDE